MSFEISKKEKEVLSLIKSSNKGLLSPAELINGIAQRDEQLIQNLVAKKYIEEVSKDHKDLSGNYYKINFYRITKQGLYLFLPWYNRFWINIKGDLRNITVSAITAIAVTIITITIKNFLNN